MKICKYLTFIKEFSILECRQLANLRMRFLRIYHCDSTDSKVLLVDGISEKGSKQGQRFFRVKVIKNPKQIFQPKLLPKTEPSNLFFYPDK